MADERLIRDISDTAAWVAMYRAIESELPDAVFRDPYARRLAGPRGEAIMKNLKWARRHGWSYTARTYNFDDFIAQEVAAGADMVVNLAAGLDTRPYRMNLPASLQWIEIDLPPMIAYKNDVLRQERPVCRVERVALDLADVDARRRLFADLARRSKRAMVVSEGLIVYLTADEACLLAGDLASTTPFQRWAIDLVSPRLLKMLQKQVGSPLSDAGAPLKFAPNEGPRFFERCGWKPVEIRSMLHSAAKLGRLPLLMRLFALFPDSKGTKPNAPWGGVVLMEKG